jgi:hypothetical protein
MYMLHKYTKRYTVSYQKRYNFPRVVVCDICDSFSAVGDWNWRKMRYDQNNKPIHLCPQCRPAAIWCEAHQQYHLANTLHRRPCVACGGLFTVPVEKPIAHCPQCRRSLPEPVEQTPQSRWPNISAALHALLARGHIGTKTGGV